MSQNKRLDINKIVENGVTLTLPAHPIFEMQHNFIIELVMVTSTQICTKKLYKCSISTKTMIIQ